MRGVLLVGSIGLALHLVLPQIPGIERSLRLVAGTSHLLVAAAFLAELASELCYAELLGRSVETTNHRSLGRWFMFRLTVTGYGAAHVLPGGGAAATARSPVSAGVRDAEQGRSSRPAVRHAPTSSRSAYPRFPRVAAPGFAHKVRFSSHLALNWT